MQHVRELKVAVLASRFNAEQHECPLRARVPPLFGRSAKNAEPLDLLKQRELVNDLALHVQPSKMTKDSASTRTILVETGTSEPQQVAERAYYLNTNVRNSSRAASANSPNASILCTPAFNISRISLNVLFGWT
jgi:hypothetical protein